MRPTIDLHQSITDRIIAAIEAGATSSGPRWLTMAAGVPTRHNGEPYRGINSLILALTAMHAGYRSSTWMTFKQAIELGGGVRKGEKATQVVFYKTLEIEREGDNGDPETRAVPMLRQFHVFNVDQIDGLPDRYALPAIVDQLPAKARDDAAERVLRATGASISDDGGNSAFYRPSTDSIHLPRFELFRTTELYLATMAHELIHWTGAKHRLDRDGGKRFGDTDYAFEELVAEIGAAFVCGRLGLAADHIDDHASYVASWLKALRNDKRLIFRAAAQAQLAADMVLVGAGDADRIGPAKPAAADPLPAARVGAPTTMQAAFAF